jgi:hypothetical protein
MFVPWRSQSTHTQPHPTEVDESSTLAVVNHPNVDVSTLPSHVVVGLSTLQMETVALIARSWSNGHGFLLGDSTGLGKGRVCAAALALHCLTTGKRGVWITSSRNLITDAQRDLNVIGMLKVDEHVKFSTYGSLIHQKEDIAKWLGPGALLVLDEAHVASNPNTKSFAAVRSLEALIMNPLILYSSATSASSLTDLGYLRRLHMWGPPSGFATLNVFQTQLETFGKSACELLMVHLKQSGKMVSRQLSMRGVDVRMQQCVLNDEERALYDRCARHFTIESDVQHHRFFATLLTAIKMRHAIIIAKQAVADGFSVVIGLQGTLAAAMSRSVLANSKLPGHGPPPSMLTEMSGLANMPIDPIDQVIWAFGAENVAELTGRTQRVVPDGAGFKFSKKPTIAKAIESFQSDRVHVAVLSKCGSTGISLHALGNRPRMHITVELPWSAEQLVQQCGRAHRAGETHRPSYVVLTTDVPSELRVIATVASRLQDLGALRDADRDTASNTASGGLVSMGTLGGITLPAIRRMCLATLIAAICARSKHRLVIGAVNRGLLRVGTEVTSLFVERRALAILEKHVNDPSDPDEPIDHTAPIVLQTILSALPGLRYIAARHGILGIHRSWHPLIHAYWPKRCRVLAQTWLLCCKRAGSTGVGLLGQINTDVQMRVVKHLADGWATPRAYPALNLRSASVNDVLNSCMRLDLDTQQDFMHDIADMATDEDTELSCRIMTLHEYILPKYNPGNMYMEIETNVTSTSLLVIKVTVHVPEPLYMKPPPVCQMVSMHPLTVAIVGNEAVQIVSPGRLVREVTRNNWAYESTMCMKGDPVWTGTNTLETVWLNQALVYQQRLKTDSKKRERTMWFVQDNPMAWLSKVARPPQVLHITELGKTLLLLNEEIAFTAGQKRQCR